MKLNGECSLTDHISLPVLHREQAQQMEQLLAERYGLVPLQTMENAGRHIATVAKWMLDDEVVDRPVVVLAGRGNKGGCGLVAARHLLNWGAWVQIVCSHPTDEYADAPAHQLRTLQAMGAPLAWAEEGWELPPCDLVIDAVVGRGLRGELHGRARDLAQLANSSVAPILSVDAPSGVDAWEGVIYTPHIRAEATLLLGFVSQGVLVDEARLRYGDLYLADVGLPFGLYEEVCGEEVGSEISRLWQRDSIVYCTVVDGVVQIDDE